VRVVRARADLVPRTALALDPGFADVAAAVAVAESLFAADLPLILPAGGALMLGRIDGHPLAAWTVPPGASLASRAATVRLARLLGAERLVTLVRARSLATEQEPAPGVVEDHVGFTAPNPLVGRNLDELGPRFPDMSAPYDPGLRALAREEAARSGSLLESGIYAAVPDSGADPPIPHALLREVGCRWIGTGGVGEAVVARHAGMAVLALVAPPGAERTLAPLAGAVLARLG
jgi:purine-nucleoside phosphorylase